MLSLRTGNTILDEIMKLEFGSSNLVIDQNFSESKQFLSAMLGNSIWSNKSGIAELSTGKSTVPGTEFFPLEAQALSYFSTTMNSLREGHSRWVLIHTYLPELLVSFESEAVLRLLQSWKESISTAETVELYLLPGDTFKDFERALRSIVDGVIEITPQTGDQPGTFTLIRGCGLEYENRTQEYLIRNGRLLIKWGNHFLESLTLTGEQEMTNRASYLNANKSSLKIITGHNQAENATLHDKLYLSQIINKTVDHALTLFPDMQNELLDKLVRWYYAGCVDFEKVKLLKKETVKKELSLKTKIALHLPTFISATIVRKAGMRREVVPAQAYLVRRQVDEAFYQQLFPRGLPAPSMDLESVEVFLNNMTTRMVTYDVISKLGEDPRNVLKLDWLPKIVKLMLKIGYSVDANINRAGENEFIIQVKECPVCLGLKTDKPVCGPLVGAILGNAAMCFKKRFECVENSCKAMGDDGCTFYLEITEPEPVALKKISESSVLKTPTILPLDEIAES